MSKKKKPAKSSAKKVTPKVTSVKKTAPTPVSTTVSEQDEKAIEKLDQETENLKGELNSENAPLTDDDKAKVEEAKKGENVKFYLEYLQEINGRINGLLEKVGKMEVDANIRDETTQKASENLKKDRDEFDNKTEEFKKKIEDLNNRERNVFERELQIDNGEYTGTIRSLLDALNTSSREISAGTKTLLDDLGVAYKKTLSNSKELAEKENCLEDKKFQLEWKENQLEQDRKKLERDKRKAQTDEEIYKENTRNELKEEYGRKYEEEKARTSVLQERYNRIEKECEDFKRTMMNLKVAFGGREPQDILNEVDRIRKESNDIREQLNSRPSLEEMDGLRKQIDALTNENERLNGLVSEREVLEMRKLIHNSDNYIVEIQSYKDRIESCKSREDSLRRTIDDLKDTIDQLKGERQKDEDAFQFAHKYDGEAMLQNKYLRASNPVSLYAFATYMRQKIASSDKPFYYDIDTIRVFIAGLHMSNISILQGISGTGKTSLPREFAKAIISDDPDYEGIGEDNMPKTPYRICAVQSGWRDSMDLMGYYNSFDRKYKETEFFKALYLANLPKYEDTLFFIILDEMNLSRPEHYFADFLSLLEQSEDERYIDVNAPEEVLPKEVKGGRMRVPKNVRFIGTANHDESTLEFAPKTYDRSNVMDMPKNQDRNIKSTDERYNVNYGWLEKQFEKAVMGNKSYYAKFKEFVNSDDLVVLFMDMGLGVGNRFEDQAERFIGAFIETGEPEKKGESLAKAADHLIASRLFRSLKNRYDLDKSKLQSFKDDYIKLFKQTFKGDPQKAIDLLDDEISRK